MKILTDPREISALVHHDGSRFRHVCDTYGTWKILPYEEPGQMAMVPWLRGVDREHRTTFRVPAHAVIIEYGSVEGLDKLRHEEVPF